MQTRIQNSGQHALHLITGRAGSKKSTVLYGEMRKVAENGDQSLLIVPEQYALMAERELIHALGGSGLWDAEVLPFSRLEQRVLSEMGGLAVKTLDDARLSMRLRLLLKRMHASLRYYDKAAQTMGFVPEILAMLKECGRYDLTPDKLYGCARQAASPQLSAKLLDIADIMRAMGGICGEYTWTPQQRTNGFIERIPGSFLSRTHVFIDGFEMWTRQIECMVEQILITSPSLTLTLFLPEPKDGDMEIFMRERRMRSSLLQMANRHNIPVTHTRCAGGALRACGPIRHVERNLYAYPFAIYPGKQRNVRLYLADGVQQEIEFAAQALIRLSRDKGCRYSDMAVVTGDLEGSENAIREVFARAGIPFYIDARRSLGSHPLLKLMAQALNCLGHGFARQDIIELLKTGLTPLSPEQCDAFENFLLAANCGHGMLRGPLHCGGDMEALRIMLMEPLLWLEQALKEARNGADAAQALQGFLQRYPVEQRMEELAQAYPAAQVETERSVHAQALDKMTDMLARLSEHEDIAGDCAQIADILKAGCASESIGVLPPEGDVVMVGSASRSMPTRIRALVVLSLNDGLIPPGAPAGMLTDDEVEALRGQDIVLGRTRTERVYNGALAIYRLFARPTEYLYVCAHTGYGHAPGMLFFRLRDLFGGMPASRCGGLCFEGRALSLRSLAAALRSLRDGVQQPKMAFMLYRAMRKQWPEDTERLMRALTFTPRLPALPEERARALFMPRCAVSTTRLNAFIACPFLHFVQYGLRAQPRPRYEETRADVGSLMHTVLERFIAGIMRLGRAALPDPEGAQALLKAIFDRAVAEHRQGILEQAGQWAFLKASIYQALSRAAEEICAHLRQSDAFPVLAEAEFGPGGQLPPLTLQTPAGSVSLRGKIDRVDLLIHRGEKYYCVVDYKSGGDTRLSLPLIEEGYALQLPLYMLALQNGLSGFGRALALLYQPLRLPPAVYDAAPPEAIALKGAVLDDAAVLRRLDHTLENGARARFIPAKLTQKGALSGQIAGPCSQDAMEEMMSAATGQAELAAVGMLQGEISPRRPRACRYCEARAQCFLSLSVPEEIGEVEEA